MRTIWLLYTPYSDFQEPRAYTDEVRARQDLALVDHGNADTWELKEITLYEGDGR